MKQLISTDNYQDYKDKQWKSVDRIYELKLFSKHIDLISKLSIPESEKENSKVLCVGARYGIEIEAFKQLGYKNVTAVDIYPRSNRVIEGDMHFLPFSDHIFNIVYTHHSLDHSLFPQKAIEEMYRVSVKGAFWLHTIPFDDYGKEEAVDFDNPEEIQMLFKRYISKIIYMQEVIRNKYGFVEPAGFCLPSGWNNELRLILKVDKK
ncbi:class I SAM-dependent methyltransferase [Saccharicrinis sp. FJH2]|uniref:class I SAM-dependent methyltransferase n=1 Tax=Saccharicrinis sp. FJH65 TaxID=3344659 RepID=UPI0035F2A0A8